MTAKAATNAATGAASPDVGASVDAVFEYCSSIAGFVKRAKPTLEYIEALSATPPPTENIPGLDIEAQLPPTAPSLYDRFNALDNHLEDMDVDYSFRPPDLPIPVRVNRLIDAEIRERGVREQPALISVLERLQDADRIQGDELCRQAELTAHAITAQQVQKREHDSMAAELSEVRTGYRT